MIYPPQTGLALFPSEILDTILEISCTVDFGQIPARRITTPFLLDGIWEVGVNDFFNKSLGAGRDDNWSVGGSVCREWRDIIWSNPRSWTALVLRLSWMYYFTQIKLLDFFLRKSGSYPLSICIEADHHVFQYNPPREALRMITEHCKRWEYLDICMSDNGLKLMQSVLNSNEPQVPLLRGLRVKRCQETRRMAPHITSFEVAPQLTSVSLYSLGIRTLLLPLTQLTSIEGYGQTTNVTIDLLEDCTNLVHCHFIAVLWTYEQNFAMNWSPSTRITLPGLKSLYITNTDRNSMNNILNFISCPALQELRLDSIKTSDEPKKFNGPADLPWSMIEDFIIRSRCPLDVIELATTRFNDPDPTISIIQRLPLLRKITLTEDMKANKPNIVGDDLIAEIRYIGRVSYGLTLDLHRIYNMLSKRWDAQPSEGVSRLKVLDLKIAYQGHIAPLRASAKVWRGVLNLQKEGLDIAIATTSGVDLLDLEYLQLDVRHEVYVLEIRSLGMLSP
ncbi:hypothetical protein BDQ17DRAFT_1330378 [Cyathus striatus]|nr:hypothetical protein BDQ17DRAFT_1330378 [Cyathus striatus]